ncbi:MAG: hypothetical protein WBF87_10095 [Mesorhizobium sp.]
MRVLLALLMLPLLAPAPAWSADGMTMYMRNQRDRDIVVEFRGRQSGTVWPGRGQVYALEPKQRKSVTIGCADGEQVCYGAWVNGNDRISFGVGPDDDKVCEDCCRICVGGSTERVDIGE